MKQYSNVIAAYSIMKTFNVLSSETKNYIDNVLEEKSNITFVDYQEIEKLVLNNQELKSLEKRKKIFFKTEN